MRYLTPGLIFALAAAITVFAFCGNDSYARMLAQRQSLREERQHNAELAARVNDLKRRISGLQKDNRVLEKAARNELGMARPGELLFFFEHKGSDGN